METPPAQSKNDPEIRKEIDRLGIVCFDPPLPPVRVPRDAGGSSSLGFRSEIERHAAQDSCTTEVFRKCKEGARQGCAVQAAKKCKRHWALKMVGFKERDWTEVEGCEEEFMVGCISDAEEGCRAHAKSFCSVAFRNPDGGREKH
ncbi:hypothetical protein BSKO_01694 [Bryopsis sp. KO-2023]|nr:hypothetical protein BSKO_01694 [Bryopsis sp. KO-2023]